MEPLSPLQKKPFQQISPRNNLTGHDSFFWDTFFKVDSEKKQFIQNLQYDLSRLINRNLRKSRESIRKWRESYQ